MAEVLASGEVRMSPLTLTVVADNVLAARKDGRCAAVPRLDWAAIHLWSTARASSSTNEGFGGVSCSTSAAMIRTILGPPLDLSK